MRSCPPLNPARKGCATPKELVSVGATKQQDSMLQTSSLTGMCSNLEPQDEQAAFPLVMALWWAWLDLNQRPHPDPKIHDEQAGGSTGAAQRSRSKQLDARRLRRRAAG